MRKVQTSPTASGVPHGMSPNELADLARGNLQGATAALSEARDLLGRWNDSRRLMLG